MQIGKETSRANSNVSAGPQSLPAEQASVEQRTVADPDVSTGHVRMPREMFRRLGVGEGQVVRMEYGDRFTLLRATAGVFPWAESNPEDLIGIGARSGARLLYAAEKTSQSS